MEHYRSAGPDTRRFPTLPKAMPYCRGSLGTHARPCPILCRRRLQLAPAIRGPSGVSAKLLPRRRSSQKLPTVRISRHLVTSELRRQRKWDGGEDRAGSFVSGRGLRRSTSVFVFPFPAWTPREKAASWESSHRPAVRPPSNQCISPAQFPRRKIRWLAPG